MARKSEKNKSAVNLGEIVARNINKIEKSEKEQKKKIITENKKLKKTITLLKNKLEKKSVDLPVTESGYSSSVNKLIKETAMQAIINIKKDYKRKECGLENEMNKLIESLKKEKGLLDEEKRSLEKEIIKFRDDTKKQKADIQTIKNGLTEKIRAEEHALREKLLEEKEQSLVEQEKKYLENLIKNLETES